MSQSIGELFVNLGIKGSEKTVSALGEVKKGLSGLTSLSLEAKAGIVGALYALERLTSASGAMGTGLTNFTALTGISAKSLQEWQYAARQAGVSAEEMEGSMKGVQNSMTNMLLTGQMPAGYGAVASKVGLDQSRIRDTQYVLGQLQKYAQQVPPELASNILKSFGLGEGVIAGMVRNKFTPDIMRKAPTYSDNEVKALDKANIAWSNLGLKIEMAVGHLNAMHGGQLVKDISQLTDKVIAFSNALITLAEKLHVFQLIGKSFEGWTDIFKVGTDVAKSFAGGTAKKDAGNLLESIPGAMYLMLHDLSQLVAPKDTNNPNLGQNQNVQVNQNLIFNHDGKDADKTGRSVHKATKDAFRQLPSQKQAS